MLFVGAYIGRLATKTTDVNWTKAKDLGDHMGYYKDRLRTTPYNHFKSYLNLNLYIKITGAFFTSLEKSALYFNGRAQYEKDLSSK